MKYTQVQMYKNNLQPNKNTLKLVNCQTKSVKADAKTKVKLFHQWIQTYLETKPKSRLQLNFGRE